EELEQDEPFAKTPVLGRDRLLHLEQELRIRPDLVDRCDLRSRPRVRIVRKRAALAGTRLDQDVMPALHELARARGCERDAVLVGLDLLDDPDPHGARTLPFRAGRTFSTQFWHRHARLSSVSSIAEREAG